MELNNEFKDANLALSVVSILLSENHCASIKIMAIFSPSASSAKNTSDQMIIDALFNRLPELEFLENP